MDRLAVPLGELIAAIGRSVADAQLTIDGRVLEHFSAIYDQSVDAFEPLRAIRYQPTWYQIAEARAELAVALRVTGVGSAEAPDPRRRVVQAAPVGADYQSRFNYRRESASVLKFRIVPVPGAVQTTGA